MAIKLEDSVNHKIATLAGLLKRQVFRIIAENKLNITPDQWVILYYLWQEDGLTVGSLASLSKKDFGNITRIIDKLVKLEYVEKRKSDIDSRVSHIFLLPGAEEIKESIQKCWKQSTDIALKGINDSEKSLMLNLLDRIESNILEEME